jgi:hypothetical protein
MTTPLLDAPLISDTTTVSTSDLSAEDPKVNLHVSKSTFHSLFHEHISLEPIDEESEEESEEDSSSEDEEINNAGQDVSCVPNTAVPKLKDTPPHQHVHPQKGACSRFSESVLTRLGIYMNWIIIVASIVNYGRWIVVPLLSQSIQVWPAIVACLAVAGVTCYSLIDVTRADPGYTSSLFNDKAYCETYKFRTCDKCGGLPKPKFCQHCVICNKCVVRWDHHCPWINGCVGAHNMVKFLRFVFMGGMGSFAFLTLLIYQIHFQVGLQAFAYAYMDLNDVNFYAMHPQITVHPIEMVLMVLQMIVSACVATLLFMLFIYHTHFSRESKRYGYMQIFCSFSGDESIAPLRHAPIPPKED